MTLHLSRIGVIAAALESTPGTALAPTLPADAALVVYDIQIVPEFERTARNPVHTKLSKPSGITGGKPIRLTFKVELKGSGTAGTAPALGKLLKACGLKETIVAVTSATYAPDDETIDHSLTLDYYEHQRRWRLVGCKGNCKVMLERGKPGMFEFEFRGKLDATNPLTDDGTADLAAITYEATKPQAFMGSNIASFFSVNPMLEVFELDFGNELSLIGSANDATGFKRCMIVNRTPVGTFDIEAIENATYGNTIIGRWANGTSGALSVVVGGTAGNICTIAAAAINIIDAKPQDRNGIRVDRVQYEVNGTLDTDAEFSIAFT